MAYDAILSIQIQGDKIFESILIQDNDGRATSNLQNRNLERSFALGRMALRDPILVQD